MAEEQKELGPADFARMAAEIDSKGFTEIPDEKPSAEPEGEKPEGSESHTDTETKPPDEPKVEQTEGEQEREPDTREESEYTRAKKDRDRLDRNWQKQQELADSTRREREEFEREKAEWRKQKEKESPSPEPVSDKDEKGYSAQDYERLVEEFLLEGNKDAADTARERAKQLRLSTHQRLWSENVEVVKRENPGVDNPENPLHKASMRILRDIPVLNMLPDGPKHAVRIAKAEMNTSLISGLRSENDKLKSEIKRLNESMEVGGSGPMRMPSERDFESMTAKEQERELKRMAEEADRVGWT